MARNIGFAEDIERVDMDRLDRTVAEMANASLWKKWSV
jgi:hypothetical protein